MGISIDEAMDTIRLIKSALKRQWLPDEWLDLPAVFVDAIYYLEPWIRKRESDMGGGLAESILKTVR